MTQNLGLTIKEEATTNVASDWRPTDGLWHERSKQEMII